MIRCGCTLSGFQLCSLNYSNLGRANCAGQKCTKDKPSRVKSIFLMTAPWKLPISYLQPNGHKETIQLSTEVNKGSSSSSLISVGDVMTSNALLLFLIAY